MSEKKNGGMRFNAGKMRFNLIPMDALVELARVYSVGALKYDDDNWLKGMSWKEMIDCADRHFGLWQMGLHRDKDTGCHHLAMAAWNILGLLVYELRGLGTDDRTKLPIDENFNWVDGPAKELGLGLSKEELEAMRDKYAKLREEHKAKEPQLAKEESAVGPTEFLPSTLGQNGRIVCNMIGHLEDLGGQDTEGYPVYGFVERDGDQQVILRGDKLIVEDGRGNILYDKMMSREPTDRYWPESLNKDWFYRNYEATLARYVMPFDPWHIIRVIKRKTGKEPYYLSPEDREKALSAYTARALQYAKDYAVTLDMEKVKQTLESFAKKGYA